MTCDICEGNKRIRLPVKLALAAEIEPDYGVSVPQCSYKEFDCPQCVPMVPYRRVRAMKVATAYPAEEFGKFQMPIERGLAARFGEYLMREGLIRFTTSGSTDLGARADKITITAHLGVVSREDVKTAGAVPEVAMTSRPPIPSKLSRQEQKRVRVTPNAVRWIPPNPPGEPEPVTDDFADDGEPKDANATRFSGLDI